MEVILKRKSNKQFCFGLENDQLSVDLIASQQMEDGNIGFRPMETLLGSLASCLSIDMLNILYKKKYVIDDYQVKIKGIRQESAPHAFTHVELSFEIWGEAKESSILKALELSKTKYCSVLHSLNPSIKITTSLVLNPSK